MAQRKIMTCFSNINSYFLSIPLSNPSTPSNFYHAFPIIRIIECCYFWFDLIFGKIQFNEFTHCTGLWRWIGTDKAGFKLALVSLYFCINHLHIMCISYLQEARFIRIDISICHVINCATTEVKLIKNKKVIHHNMNSVNYGNMYNWFIPRAFGLPF